MFFIFPEEAGPLLAVCFIFWAAGTLGCLMHCRLVVVDEAVKCSCCRLLIVVLLTVWLVKHQNTFC